MSEVVSVRRAGGVRSGDAPAGKFGQCLVGRGCGLSPLRQPSSTVVSPHVGARTVDVFERAENPDDPFELRDLFVGRVESELGDRSRRGDLAAKWRSSRRRRQVEPEMVYQMPATSRWVKELFNFFFRNDLYGALRNDDTVILSSGAALESRYQLPGSLKQCVSYALDRDWYGYSDSRGRLATREAVAELENIRIPGAGYSAASVSISMGSTAAMHGVADFLLHGRSSGTSLCLAPNYPPLVEAVARRGPVRIVGGSSGGGFTDIEGLIDALQPDTPLVMLQTVTNPTGLRVSEEALDRLIRSASPETVIVLDEAHECSGPPVVRARTRAASNVVRLVSLSKNLSVPGLKLGWIVSSEAFGSAFYEYASTAYGGPPSVFALLIEVAANFERWAASGIDRPSAADVAPLMVNYQWRRDDLVSAYYSYMADLTERNCTLVAERGATEAALVELGFEVVSPEYSLNVALRVDPEIDSYRSFRTAMQRANVAVYPGVLNHFFDEPVVRITSAVHQDVLDEGIRRFANAMGR